MNRLRVSKRCGHYYILGQWLLDWIAGGELSVRKPATAVEPPTAKEEVAR
jgi:hypothetical protein